MDLLILQNKFCKRSVQKDHKFIHFSISLDTLYFSQHWKFPQDQEEAQTRILWFSIYGFEVKCILHGLVFNWKNCNNFLKDCLFCLLRSVAWNSVLSCPRLESFPCCRTWYALLLNLKATDNPLLCGMTERLRILL